jgi:chromosome partitioning protein
MFLFIGGDMSAQAAGNDFMLSTTDLAKLVGLEPGQVIAEIESKFGVQPSRLWLAPTIVRRYLSLKNRTIPSRVVSFQMLKGGVAKTTSALNFGLRAAQYGARVLFVDLDQQANLTFALGVDSEEIPVFIDVVERKKGVEEVLLSIDQGIDLLPSSLNNSVLDRVLMNGQRNWSQAVVQVLKEIRARYDLVIIDTAPQLSAINTAVTCASDTVVLPVNPDKFSLLGLRKTIAELEMIREDFSLNFHLKVLFTRFDSRESASREILSQCIDSFEDLLIKTYVRSSSDVKNTIRGAKTLYATKSKAKEDYDLVSRELLGWD